MLTSPANINLGLVSVISAAVLSFSFGLAGAALPFVPVGAGEASAARLNPSSPTLRARVDRRQRAQVRDDRIMHLREEIAERGPADHDNWSTFERRRERIGSVAELTRHHT